MCARRWGFWFLLSLGCLVFCIVGSLPMTLGTSWGKECICILLSKGLGVRISVDQLHLAWWRDQYVKGVEIQSPHRDIVFSCSSCTIDSGLWHFLFSSSEIHRHLHMSDAVVQCLDETGHALSCISLDAEIEYAQIGTPIQIQVRGTWVAADTEVGRFSLDGACDISADCPRVQFALDAFQLPVKGVDHILGILQPACTGMAEAIAGKTLDLHLNLDVSRDYCDGKVTLHTPQYEGSMQITTQDGDVILVAPSRSTLHCSPELAARFLSLHPLFREVSLINTPEIEIDVYRLCLPCRGGKFDIGALAATVQMRLKNLTFATSMCKNSVCIEEFIADVNTLYLQEAISYTGEMVCTYGEERCSFASTSVCLFPYAPDGTWQLALSAKSVPISLLEETGVTYTVCQYLFGERVDLCCAIDYANGMQQVRVHCDSPIWKMEDALFACADNRWHLAQPLTCTFAATQMCGLQMSPISVSVTSLSLDERNTIECVASATATQVAYGEIALTNVTMGCTIQGPDSIRVQVDSPQLVSTCMLRYDPIAQTLVLAEPLSALLSVDIPKWGIRTATPICYQVRAFSAPLRGEFFRNMTMHGHLDASNILFYRPLPRSSVSEVHPATPPLLVSLFGTTGSCQADIMCSPQEIKIACKIGSELLACNIGIVQEGETLRVQSQQPCTCSWTITPEGCAVLYDLFAAKPAVFPKGSCRLEGRIARLTIPLEHFSLDHMTLEATISSDRIALVDVVGEEILLDHFKSRFDKDEINAPLCVRCKSFTQVGTKAGLIDIQGEIAGLRRMSGTWDLADLSLRCEMHLQQFPSAILDALTSAYLPPATLSTFFSPETTGSFKAELHHWSGPIKLMINTPATRVSVGALLTSGVLTLQQPCHAQMTVTPQLSRLFLKAIHPLSIVTMASEGPLSVDIAQPGVSIPLYPNNRRSIRIPQARIELGKIRCTNQGNVAELLTLLKMGPVSAISDLELWFAPIDISIDRGSICCERTDIRINRAIDICTWGVIDLVDEQVYGHLGLTAQALHRAFKIRHLPIDYVLPLSLKGPINHVELDIRSATAAIATLLRWQESKAILDSIDSKKGRTLGNLIGRWTELPYFDQPIPPAKHPLPWDTQPAQHNEHHIKRKKHALRPGDKPMKQILKLLRTG